MERFLEQIDPYTFTGSAFLLGILLANDLTEDEQNSVGNWLQLVGMAILTYSSQVVTLSSSKQTNQSTTCSTSTMESIEKAIFKMQQELEKIKKGFTNEAK